MDQFYYFYILYYIILYTYFYVIFNIFISVLVMFILQLILFQLVTKATFLSSVINSFCHMLHRMCVCVYVYC